MLQLWIYWNHFYQGQGLYVDNLYTSTHLAHELIRQDTFMDETMRL